MKKIIVSALVMAMVLTNGTAAFALTSRSLSSAPHSSSSATTSSSASSASSTSSSSSSSSSVSTSSSSPSSSSSAVISQNATSPTSSTLIPVASANTPQSSAVAINPAQAFPINTASMNMGSSMFTVLPATNITGTSATLNVQYSLSRTDLQNGGIDLMFVYDTHLSLSYVNSPQTAYTRLTNLTGTHSVSVTGLVPNTTYYVRIIGNSAQTTYTGNNNISFTTLTNVGASVFNVLPATNVTQTTADLNVFYGLSRTDIQTGGVDVKFVYDTTPNINYTTSPSTTFTNLSGNPATHTRTVTGLIPNTTYYYNVVGNGALYSYTGSPTQSFTTASNPTQAPIMVTVAASNIANTSARLNGTYNAQNSNTDVWFEYGTTPALGSTTSAVNVGTGSSAYNQTVSGLQTNTLYYFRAVGQNSFGTSYASNVLTFTTSNTTSSSSSSGGGGGGGTSAPDISTMDATSVSDIHATLNGHYNANGIATTTWFEFSKDKSEVEDHSAATVGRTNHGTGVADFSAGIPSTLVAGTTYYFRAVAENSKGTVYGTIKSFTTIGTPIDTTDFTALTSLATSIGISGATLNGIVQNGNNESIRAWFEYGTSATALNQSTDVKSLGSNTALFTSNGIANLIPDTIYYFRIVAQSPTGTSHGEIRIFRTLGGQVATDETIATSVTGTSSKFIALSIADQAEEVLPGDAMTYTVSFKNKTQTDIQNTVLEIALPNEISFESASEGQFDSTRNTLVVNVGTLGGNIEGKVTVNATVEKSAQSKGFLLTNALMKYVNPESTGQEEAIAYVVNSVGANGNALTAASIFGDGGFLPSTLVGWLSLLLVIAGLIFLGRYVYVGKKKKQQYAAPDNLPY